MMYKGDETHQCVMLAGWKSFRSSEVMLSIWGIMVNQLSGTSHVIFTHGSLGSV